ncbi:MAG: hypothetical protein AAGB15_06060 [Pseudomonadota bacterium]
MANPETITVTLADGTVDTFPADEGLAAIDALAIEATGYGYRPDPASPMVWYTAADVISAVVS